MEKEQRKKIEHIITSNITSLLNAYNSEAAKAIQKHIYEASKLVAKKFVKALPKPEKQKVTKPGANTYKKAAKKQAPPKVKK